jgi:predicted N-acetyltransferase YhbS
VSARRFRAVADSARLSILVRPETPDDHDAIRSLTARAFAGLACSDGSEPRVIDALRRDNARALSLVAMLGERVAGHIAFSEAGLRDLRERRAAGCVLLGDHRYYHRFGFSVAPALAPLRCFLLAPHFRACGSSFIRHSRSARDSEGAVAVPPPGMSA